MPSLGYHQILHINVTDFKIGNQFSNGHVFEHTHHCGHTQLFCFAAQHFSGDRMFDDLPMLKHDFGSFSSRRMCVSRAEQLKVPTGPITGSRIHDSGAADTALLEFLQDRLERRVRVEAWCFCGLVFTLEFPSAWP